MGGIVLITGNVSYFVLKSHFHLAVAAYAVAAYISLILTYILIGLLLTPSPVIKYKMLYYFFDIFLLVLLLFPFIFPFMQISLFLLETHLYIFLALLLGYSVKSTLKLKFAKS